MVALPHPDSQIVDVPLTLGQVQFVCHLIEEAVATGRTDADVARGPILSLYGAVPENMSALRPGQMHWAVRS